MMDSTHGDLCPACGGSKGYFSYTEMQIFPCDECSGFGYVETTQHKGEHTMNYSTAVLLINSKVRAIKGQYEEKGEIVIFKTLDQSLKVNDFAVVESGTRWGITTVKVCEVDCDVDFDSSKQIGWVVSKVDMSGHDDIKKMEAAAIDLIKKGELRKRREDIRKNTLDAVSAGEIDSLAIARLGAPAAEEPQKPAPFYKGDEPF